MSKILRLSAEFVSKLTVLYFIGIGKVYRIHVKKQSSPKKKSPRQNRSFNFRSLFQKTTSQNTIGTYFLRTIQFIK
ncbi:hypothetical protein LEP1GSC043_2921 [Leptospira weilii str. Ecochallenge]|uniref:Uncharacterized protein n=2 Tax=Leptospira weilii TaxID=28184 RepID=N1U970_9LEPT|nr:hypothetical protein LEP1GSC108_3084 [Leptospira weilii str. UI 13098]EMY14479.1 hypothetical protein LEP1GSC043_2921 [Leptospira weilii str. Ecochallenge]